MIQGYLVDNLMLLRIFGCYAGMPLQVRNSFFNGRNLVFFRIHEQYPAGTIVTGLLCSKMSGQRLRDYGYKVRNCKKYTPVFLVHQGLMNSQRGFFFKIVAVTKPGRG